MLGNRGSPEAWSRLCLCRASFLMTFATGWVPQFLAVVDVFIGDYVVDLERFLHGWLLLSWLWYCVCLFSRDVSCCLVVQSCPTLCDPVDSWPTRLWPALAYQAPLTMEIIQARTLEWVAMPSSRGSSRPGIFEFPALAGDSLLLSLREAQRR